MNTKEMYQQLASEIEGGTFVRNHEGVVARLREVLEPGGVYAREAGLEEMAVKMLAGLAIYYPEEYQAEFLTTLVREDLQTTSLSGAVEPVRYYLSDPFHSAGCLDLFEAFVFHPIAAVADFSTRTFLQTLSELHVGGNVAQLVNRPPLKAKLTELLLKLEKSDWIEAVELLDYLELRSQEQ